MQTSVYVCGPKTSAHWVKKSLLRSQDCKVESSRWVIMWKCEWLRAWGLHGKAGMGADDTVKQFSFAALELQLDKLLFKISPESFSCTNRCKLEIFFKYLFCCFEWKWKRERKGKKRYIHFQLSEQLLNLMNLSHWWRILEHNKPCHPLLLARSTLLLDLSRHFKALCKTDN